MWINSIKIVKVKDYAKIMFLKSDEGENTFPSLTFFQFFESLHFSPSVVVFLEGLSAFQAVIAPQRSIRESQAHAAPSSTAQRTTRNECTTVFFF